MSGGTRRSDDAAPAQRLTRKRR